MLTAKEIRSKFLEFFKKNHHTEVASSSLIPKDDPSLLFTNAGMVQFKKIFTGQEKRDYIRATTAQKCLRAGGKHNDLDNVGRTARHHTFFEMLGNFSFGDYFKEDAMRFAWTFITEELKLPKDRLYITIYKDDDEAFELWRKISGIDPSRIYRLGEKDNFWSMGDTGPCGPCSEIHYDQGEDMACGPNCGIGTCDCDRFLEIWNLVFMQYDQQPDGTRLPLPRPSIDTGMGLERIAAICQGVRSNYDTDLFQQFIGHMAGLAGVTYGENPDADVALRVIADHSRAIAFLIADGILPSNEGRGYVLRRLIRRAFRFGRLIGMQDPFLYKTALKVVEVMEESYPELRARADFMERVVREEEERFYVTLDKGLALLEEAMADLSASGKTCIEGETLFRLYDTYGFPLDIVNDIAGKRGFIVDEQGFNAHMKEQKARARANWKGSGDKDLMTRFKALLEDGIRNEFLGYETLSCCGRTVSLLDADALPVEKLVQGEKGFIVTDRMPFYGAGGGQIGDRGTVTAPAGRAAVIDTLKPLPALSVAQIEVTEGELYEDQEVEQSVDLQHRTDTARNHSATHLLQAALRKVLGDHVHQAGSLVTPDSLRFDFTHIAAFSQEELRQVEDIVNTSIMAAYPVAVQEMKHDEAIKMGAMALFSEKYGDTVRVVSMGDDSHRESVELCGGTHVANTGMIGSLTILSESGIAAGVRRIEAVTGRKAIELRRKQTQMLSDISAMLKSQPDAAAVKVDSLLKENRTLRRDLEKASARLLSGESRDMMQSTEEINGIRLLAVKAPAMNIKALREVMDDIRSKMPSGVACLAAADPDNDQKVSMILYVSKDLHDRFKAPECIRQVAAPINGSGGGRPDQAQAGGTNPAGIGEAFSVLRRILQDQTK
ncbi:MAG: alanine--tRNA ligase [Desulfovibrionaceae bacterium]|nr:alanine--tRNA ligase [Desulfovibrionaceae bacterium]